MAARKAQHAESTAILILGMHRSGTSALTRVLNLLGADISSDLMHPNKENETGYWESVEVYKVHERLLASLGRTWFDVMPMPAGWVETPVADLAVQELVGVLSRDFARSRVWVVKDPRMCRLLPLWRRVLAAVGSKPVAVFMVRHPDEVAKSLYRAVGEYHGVVGGLDYAKLLWAEHLLDAEHDTRDMPRAMLTYEELLRDWSITIERLGRELTLSWPREIGAASVEIEAFIDTQQRHHVTLGNVHGKETALAKSNWFHRLYGACVDGGTAEAKWRHLQHLRKPYDDGMSVLGPGFAECLSHSTAELEKARTWGKQQNDQLAASGSELYQTRIQLQQRDAELTQVRAALDEQSALVAERSKALYEKSHQLQQRDAELAQVRAALDEQSALVAERSKALYEKSHQLQQRDAELAQVRAALDEQSALVAERSQALYAHRVQLQQRDAELGQVRAALDEQGALVAERSKELYERRLQLQQLDAELQHQREAMTVLGEQGAASEKRCGDYERALGSKQAALEALEIDKERLDTQLKELQAKVSRRRWLLGRFLLGERYRH